MEKVHLTEEKKEHILFLILPICLYIGALLLTFYLIEYGISPGMFPFFNKLSDSAAFGNMLAVFVLNGALVCYEYATDKMLSVSYIAMIVIAVLAVSIHGNGPVMAFMLFIPIITAAFINPVAERMKRLLQMFFMEAFLFANMSLLFNYTELIHTQGAVYSLESSVIGELTLAVFALIVMKEWDRLPQNEDITRVRLCTLRRKCRKVLQLCGLLLAFSMILGWDMGALSDNIFVSFQKPDGTAAEAGIFTSVVCRLFYGINKGFSQALSRNIFGVLASRTGFIGVILAGIVLAYLGYILYRHLRYTDTEGDVWDLIAVVGFSQLIVLPVCLELVPFWCICIFLCAVRTTGWKLSLFGKKNAEETEVDSEKEETENEN